MTSIGLGVIVSTGVSTTSTFDSSGIWTGLVDMGSQINAGDEYTIEVQAEANGKKSDTVKQKITILKVVP